MTNKRIAIISPAGAVLPERIDGAALTLRQWGYEPILSDYCKLSIRAYGVINHSSTLDQRRHDLIWAITDPSIDAILCARGGYGAIQLLDTIDPKLVADNPKPIIGFSDITALHALWHSAGVRSIHAPMAKHLAECGPMHPDSQRLHCLLEGRLDDISVNGHQFNRPGKATAPLIGGNLALLYALLASPYNLVLPGHILFVEDIAEQVYQVQRMLHALRLAGRLQHLAGLIVGQFTDYRENHEGDAMMHMISDMVAPYGYPVAMGFPIGHVEHNIPLVEGAMVQLTVTQQSTHLAYV